MPPLPSPSPEPRLRQMPLMPPQLHPSLLLLPPLLLQATLLQPVTRSSPWPHRSRCQCQPRTRKQTRTWAWHCERSCDTDAPADMSATVRACACVRASVRACVRVCVTTEFPSMICQSVLSASHEAVLLGPTMFSCSNHMSSLSRGIALPAPCTPTHQQEPAAPAFLEAAW